MGNTSEIRNILDVKNLTVRFSSRAGTVYAVEGLSFWIAEGQLLGIAGESGCGKTTAAMALPRLLSSNAVITGGEVFFNGQDLLKKTEKEMEAIRWKGISVIFQGAMNALNPLQTVGRQIAEPILLHEPGVSADEAERRARELMERVNIAGSRFSNYPHEFSGGMRQRVMIAMSLACRPKLVIADEPTTALDVMIQAQILETLRELVKVYHLSVVMISHDLSVLAEICDKIAIMYAGSMVEYGMTDEVFSDPRHPYTQRLICSYPDIRRERTFVRGIAGYPPNLLEKPKGCPFYNRCVRRKDYCAERVPKLELAAGDHYTACHECVN
jgi:peptide/nickel transport system ATP-binding protein